MELDPQFVEVEMVAVGTNTDDETNQHRGLWLSSQHDLLIKHGFFSKRIPHNFLIHISFPNYGLGSTMMSVQSRSPFVALGFPGIRSLGSF